MQTDLSVNIYETLGKKLALMLPLRSNIGIVLAHRKPLSIFLPSKRELLPSETANCWQKASCCHQRISGSCCSCYSVTQSCLTLVTPWTVHARCPSPSPGICPILTSKSSHPYPTWLHMYIYLN